MAIPTPRSPPDPMWLASGTLASNHVGISKDKHAFVHSLDDAVSARTLPSKRDALKSTQCRSNSASNSLIPANRLKSPQVWSSLSQIWPRRPKLCRVRAFCLAEIVVVFLGALEFGSKFGRVRRASAHCWPKFCTDLSKFQCSCVRLLAIRAEERY